MTTQQPDPECFRTPVPPRRNRVHWFAGRTHEVLDELGEPPTWALTIHERGETVAELVALRVRVDAQLSAVLAEADAADVAAEPVGAGGSAPVFGPLRESVPGRGLRDGREECGRQISIVPVEGCSSDTAGDVHTAPRGRRRLVSADLGSRSA